jgi:acylpyruvate hydrolase
MKLVTYAWHGQIALGALAPAGVLDLHRAHRESLQFSSDTEELAAADLHVPEELQRLLCGGATALRAALQALEFAMEYREVSVRKRLWLDPSEIDFLAPVLRPGKIVCVGLNYHSHLEEIAEHTPDYPILFHKSVTSVIGHRQAIVLPRVSEQVDYEGELAIVIGRRGKYISEANALTHVAGYTCANDVSAHDIEFRTSQWTSGKMLDTFCPLGPVLVTTDEIANPNRLAIRTSLNGRTVQESSTSEMVFSVPFLVSYISSLATLEPGDVILTGTPAGVGCNLKPQVFLRAGDEISIQLESIGTLTNPVVAEEGC